MSPMHPIAPISESAAPRPLHDTRTASPDAKKAELRKLRRAVGDFEALFLSQMLKSMQSTVKRTSEGPDSGGDVLREVGWEKVAESMAHQGGLGLGDVLFETLKDRVASEALPPTNKDPVDGTLPSDESQPVPVPLRSDREFHDLPNENGPMELPK